MHTSHFAFAAIVLSSVLAASLQAAIVPFDLLGRAGPGLLPGNEPGATVGNTGTGGEAGAGILFNDITLQLTINVAWGSGNGFEDLTGPASAGGHIHLPTPSLPPQSFNESTSVMIGLDGLPGYNSSATNGGFNGTVTLTSPQATALSEGRLYVNFHTSANPGGEIRGNMIQVPEPATASLLLFGAASAFIRSRRRC